MRHFKDALYVRQARTDIDNYNNKYILQAYIFFTDPKWHTFMMTISLLFILQVFYEPVNSADTYEVLDNVTYNYLIA